MKFLVLLLAIVALVNGGKQSSRQECRQQAEKFQSCLEQQASINAMKSLKQLLEYGQQCINENAALKTCSLDAVRQQQPNLATIQLQAIPPQARGVAAGNGPAGGAPAVPLPPNAVQMLNPQISLTEEQQQKLQQVQQCLSSAANNFVGCMKEQLGDDALANPPAQAAGQGLQDHPLLAALPGFKPAGPPVSGPVGGAPGGLPIGGNLQDFMKEIAGKICNGNSDAFESLKKCAIKKAVAGGIVKNLLQIVDPVLGACNALSNSNCARQSPVSDECKQLLAKDRQAVCQCTPKAIEFVNSSSECAQVKQGFENMKEKAEEFVAAHQNAASPPHDLPFHPSQEMCSGNPKSLEDICAAETAKINAKIEQFMKAANGQAN